MRLVQTNMKHKGYALFRIRGTKKNYVERVPLFTTDYILESEEVRNSLQKELEVQVTLDSIYISDITSSMQKLKEFQQKYNSLPRNYVEEVRTGFQNGAGLLQSLPRFVYK